MRKSTYAKILVFVTMTFFIVSIGATLIVNHSSLPTAIDIQTKDQPTLGYPKAPVRVVVFEEPKCPECKEFTNLIFPLLKKEFIETNKVLFTVIPVSFLPNSMPAANAWLCVFNQEKAHSERNLFFKYIDYMYAHQPSESEEWITDEILEKFAKETSPAIRLDEFRNCLNKQTYRSQIEKNTDYGMQLMNGELGTPTVYVNGMLAEDIKFSSLSQMINKALSQKEIK